MPDDYSIPELMAVFLAHQLHDGETLRVGVASPVPEAAVRLAHLTHGPNMELVFLGARMNVAHLDSIPMPAYGWDRRAVRWAESYSDTGHRFDRIKDWSNHLFFIGGVQVDAFGNTNLIGVGPDYRRLKFRGPGSVGTPTLSTHVGRYYIVLNNHNPRVLVQKCDYVSAFGWGSGGADARKIRGQAVGRVHQRVHVARRREPAAFAQARLRRPECGQRPRERGIIGEVGTVAHDA